jgi:hypothetical protein
MCQRAHGAAFVTWVSVDESRMTVRDSEKRLARANFTTPVDREPQVHAFYETHVPWFAFNDGLPRKPSPTT